MGKKISKSEDEWAKELSPEEFHICRLKGTEPPFSGKLLKHHEEGIYTCACCGQELFKSDTKYDSGTGWPSFWDRFSKEAVEAQTDTSHGLVRTEVLCSRCGAHLGHLFPDGPQPTGTRYCINSLALKFKKR